MDKVYEELDEAKAEVERLQAELRGKADSLQNLKKTHDAQVNEIQEAKFKVEKQDQELLQKEDEINDAKQMCEDLKGNLNNKESIIKHLSAANDKLRANCDDKFKIWEDEKRELALALEEANEKVENEEQQLNVCRQEIERLKGCLEVSNKRCLEIEKNMKASEEPGERDDMFQKLEEENMKVEEQLKWKKEQFKHLEEAHEKLRDQFKSTKNEWELEKSTLLDEISSLQTKLDTQIRTSEGLQHQLQMCNQAHAAEESQRKWYKDNVTSKYQDVRFHLDCLNSQQDKDIGDLKYSPNAKEAYDKESKYAIEKLEQENRKLRMSLKELKEAQIQEAGNPYSLSKLRSELRNLEQIHRECVSNFKARRAEWSFQLEQLTEAINSCQSELETKAAEVEDLKMELEGSHSLTAEMMLLNAELSVMLLVWKQGISEAQLQPFNDEDEMDLINKEREDKFPQLIKQLEMKDAALISVQKDINEECDKAVCLMRQVDSHAPTVELHHLLPNEIDRHKDMLEESTNCQMLTREKVLQMEIDSKEQLKEVYDAWDRRANNEFDERICEISEMEFELQIWKSLAERLKTDLEENLVIRKELEYSLLAQVDYSERLKQEKDSLVDEMEEKERSIDYLQERVVLLKQQLKARETEASAPVMGETSVPSGTGEVRYLQIIEEKDKILEEIQKEVVFLEQESLRREFDSAVIAKSSVERTNEIEKENPVQFSKGTNIRIDELMEQVTSVEEQFTISLSSFSSQLAEKQAEIYQLQEACDRITAAEILAALEIEEKKLMIVELEEDIRNIEQKLRLQEENWSQSKQLALDVEAEMDAKQLKMKELTDQMENNLRGSDIMLQELKRENRNLLENATRLSSEREKLLAFVLGLGDKMSECTTTDTQLMDMLRSIVQSFEHDGEGMNLEKEDGFLVKENVTMHSPTGKKKPETISDIRSPFKELNS